MIIVIFILAAISLWLPRERILQRYFSLIACIILGCIIGLRSFDSGTDTLAYVRYFESIDTNAIQLEPIFYLYTLFFNFLGSETAYIFSLSILPLVFIHYSCVTLNVDRPVLVICLFLSFVPGIDLITNGLRQGLALTMLLVVVAIASHRPAIRTFLYTIPVLIHFSGLMVVIADLSSRRMGTRIVSAVLALACLSILSWQVISANFLVDILTGFLGTSFPIIEKLIRYLINTKSILSNTVYLYFLVTSVFLACAIAFLYKELDQPRGQPLEVIYKISVLLFLGFGLVSFSAFAYRFMFIAFVFQVVTLGVLMDWRGEQAITKILYLFLISAGSAITYTTNTMANSTFLDVL